MVHTYFYFAHRLCPAAGLWTNHQLNHSITDNLQWCEKGNLDAWPSFTVLKKKYSSFVGIQNILIVSTLYLVENMRTSKLDQAKHLSDSESHLAVVSCTCAREGYKEQTQADLPCFIGNFYVGISKMRHVLVQSIFKKLKFSSPQAPTEPNSRFRCTEKGLSKSQTTNILLPQVSLDIC